MKKVIIIVAAIVLAAAIATGSFTVGRLTAPSSDDKGNGTQAPGTDQQTPGDNEGSDNGAEDNGAMDEKIVFFSPHTGNDETGDGSQYSPVETKKQAEKLAESITVGEKEELIYLEYLMTVDVKTQAAAGVFSDAGGINMIPFTGSSDGYYFKGDIVGTGCDTQKYPPDGSVLFSARYMLKGTDFEGKSCSIFIENNGHALEKCTPTIITDSSALSEWQGWELRAIVVPVGGGVEVNVYRIHR